MILRPPTSTLFPYTTLFKELRITLRARAWGGRRRVPCDLEALTRGERASEHVLPRAWSLCPSRRGAAGVVGLEETRQLGVWRGWRRLLVGTMLPGERHDHTSSLDDICRERCSRSSGVDPLQQAVKAAGRRG